MLLHPLHLSVYMRVSFWLELHYCWLLCHLRRNAGKREWSPPRRGAARVTRKERDDGRRIRSFRKPSSKLTPDPQEIIL